jgi:hypothetical protein
MRESGQIIWIELDAYQRRGSGGEVPISFLTSSCCFSPIRLTFRSGHADLETSFTAEALGVAKVDVFMPSNECPESTKANLSDGLDFLLS